MELQNTLAQDPAAAKLHSKKLTQSSLLLNRLNGWEADVKFWLKELQDGDLADQHWDSVVSEVGHLVDKGKEFLPSGTQSPALVEISVGPGGMEACDWKDILLKMYLNWCERAGWEVEVINHEPGASSPTIFRVNHLKSYELFKKEEGVHRLIRKSPFDRNQKTHTSFVHVLVSHEEDLPADQDISKKEVRVDVMRSSGAGGQHVNKTESAVRMVHVPTGLQVVCKQGRSQHSNRKTAWNLLLKKVNNHYAEQQASKNKDQEIRSEERGWGRQLRSYHFSDNRITDHLAQKTFHDVDAFIKGMGSAHPLAMASPAETLL